MQPKSGVSSKAAAGPRCVQSTPGKRENGHLRTMGAAVLARVLLLPTPLVYEAVAARIGENQVTGFGDLHPLFVNASEGLGVE